MALPFRQNLVNVLTSSCGSGNLDRSKRIKSYLEWRLKESCSEWQVAHTNSCFSRRVTCLRWHPTHPETVAYGTHAGDIVLWDYAKHQAAEESPKIEGIGMGNGCITEMRFHPRQLNLIYTTAVEGKFCLRDFEGRHSLVCLDTMTLDYWWCSMDYSVDHGVLLVGDNRGSAVLMDQANHKTIRKFERLHKGKIKYMEFCPARSWMLVSASVDRTVKFWDVRKFSDSHNKPTPISQAVHDGLVSSAYFDPIRGVRLLTTAQNGEIRVYDPHDLWHTPTSVVKHPHRSFQHMTDIKATWHPLHEDLCVVGRYPVKGHPNQSRTVDLIDLKTGEVCGEFYSPHTKGIIQLNQFNRSGDCLASGMGYHGLIWKPPSPGHQSQRVESGRSQVENDVPNGEAKTVKTKRSLVSLDLRDKGGLKKKKKNGKGDQTRTKLRTIITRKK